MKGGFIMSVHFFYDYKDELIKKLKAHYSESLDIQEKIMKERKQIDEAVQIIDRYFDELERELKDVFIVSSGEVKLARNDDALVHFSIMDGFIKFIRKDRSLQIVMGFYVPEEGEVESKIVAYIIPGDKKPKIKKVGKVHNGSTFDENALNHFMRMAFKDMFFYEDEMNMSIE